MFMLPWVRLTQASLLFAAVCLSAGQANPAAVESERSAAVVFENLKTSPPQLEAFLRAMPKGGDLHNHLLGAVYAENFIRWAAEDGLCVNKDRLVILACGCESEALSEDCRKSEKVISASEAIADRTLYGRLIDSLSVRNYRIRGKSGHRQFFSTFAAFGAVAANRRGDALAEVMARAAQQNILYLELITTAGMPAARRLGSGTEWDDDLQAMLENIPRAELDALVVGTSAELTEMEKTAKSKLGCGTEKPDAGCGVVVRYLATAFRTVPAPEVFSQILFGFRQARADERVVGINLVSPEDSPVALRDYRKHMRSVGFAAESAAGVGVSLHAGELTMGLVPPEHLRSHIREAVEVAGAQRIGHGSSVMFEDNPWGLLQLLRERGVLVEINLTSNAVILGLEGNRHPFPIYRAYGVPTALSTDDEGVLRTDLTHEYLRAVLTYDLGYADVKELSENSLKYAFTVDKAALLDELESRFADFEANLPFRPGIRARQTDSVGTPRRTPE